jgi:hypothetical protein
MRTATKHSCSFVLLAIMIYSFAVAAQENQTATKPLCVAADEHIYTAGVDGVKPPQPQQAKNATDAPDMRGPFSLELVVNSEGRVCDARVLNAKDQLSAKKAAEYISEHWTFKPATRQGKSVAVKLTLNWGAR